MPAEYYQPLLERQQQESYWSLFGKYAKKYTVSALLTGTTVASISLKATNSIVTAVEGFTPSLAISSTVTSMTALAWIFHDN